MPGCWRFLRPSRTETRRLLAAFAAVGVLGCAAWLVAGVWGDLARAGSGAVQALWTVPAAVAIHLVQLLLSALGWRVLVVRSPIGLAGFVRLRLMREGLNTLLPLAHVGGEVIAAQAMVRAGIPAAVAAAGMVVDVTVEVCAQLAFLVAGCVVLAVLAGTGAAWLWGGSLGLAVLGAGSLALVQRLRGLRLLETVVRGIGRQWPALLPSGGLDGLEAEALAIYRRRDRLVMAFCLQGVAWALGTAETWLVLHALGLDASVGQAFVVESLGMAARSAGFAVPGALAIQEGGFVLAAAAVDLAGTAALSLSLVKRVRELLIGLAGLACWRLARTAGTGRADPVMPGRNAPPL
jgi:putative membrane protein